MPSGPRKAPQSFTSYVSLTKRSLRELELEVQSLVFQHGSCESQMPAEHLKCDSSRLRWAGSSKTQCEKWTSQFLLIIYFDYMLQSSYFWPIVLDKHVIRIDFIFWELFNVTSETFKTTCAACLVSLADLQQESKGKIPTTRSLQRLTVQKEAESCLLTSTL